MIPSPRKTAAAESLCFPLSPHPSHDRVFVRRKVHPLFSLILVRPQEQFFSAGHILRCVPDAALFSLVPPRSLRLLQWWFPPSSSDCAPCACFLALGEFPLHTGCSFSFSTSQPIKPNVGLLALLLLKIRYYFCRPSPVLLRLSSSPLISILVGSRGPQPLYIFPFRFALVLHLYHFSLFPS